VEEVSVSLGPRQWPLLMWVPLPGTGSIGAVNANGTTASFNYP
jgi:hypothetical protein